MIVHVHPEGLFTVYIYIYDVICVSFFPVHVHVWRGAPLVEPFCASFPIESPSCSKEMTPNGWRLCFPEKSWTLFSPRFFQGPGIKTPPDIHDLRPKESKLRDQEAILLEA